MKTDGLCHTGVVLYQLNFTTALVVYIITVVINRVFISFSTVQIYVIYWYR